MQVLTLALGLGSLNSGSVCSLEWGNGRLCVSGLLASLRRWVWSCSTSVSLTSPVHSPCPAPRRRGEAGRRTEGLGPFPGFPLSQDGVAFPGQPDLFSPISARTSLAANTVSPHRAAGELPCRLAAAQPRLPLLCLGAPLRAHAHRETGRFWGSGRVAMATSLAAAAAGERALVPAACVYSLCLGRGSTEPVPALAVSGSLTSAPRKPSSSRLNFTARVHGLASAAGLLSVLEGSEIE